MNKNNFLPNQNVSRIKKEIIEFENRIHSFLNGSLREDEFRTIRTHKGVYSQRQQGVQMLRIKIPIGKISRRQMLCIATIAEEYGNGYFHITTRQDIQVYNINIMKMPEIWEKLEMEGITIIGSGGNTIRNITASATAGIDPFEPFDVSHHGEAMFRYFLCNPVSQEMGRKIKISFSSSETDSALSFVHDLGFIPKIKALDGIQQLGFKVLVGGGLGAQPVLASTAFDFIEEHQVIPFTEAVIRVFGRYGERKNRHKARLKFLIQQIGLEKFLELVESEKIAGKYSCYTVKNEVSKRNQPSEFGSVNTNQEPDFRHWLLTNVITQKQEGFSGVYIKFRGGDISSADARKFINAIEGYGDDEMRLTINQGVLLRYVPNVSLNNLFNILMEKGFAVPGYNSPANITSCRGTSTCNLAITNTLQLSLQLEEQIINNFPELINNTDIKIKVSGCMNSCGQQTIATIGFHGSTIKHEGKSIPALQVMLGGGIIGDGKGRLAEKILKVPTKRARFILNVLLSDYTINRVKDECYNDYFDRKGKFYFFQLLKPLADLSSLDKDEVIDWGHNKEYKPAIGSGECAGAIIDEVESNYSGAKKYLEKAQLAIHQEEYAESLFCSYRSFVLTAKGYLIYKGRQANSDFQVIEDFSFIYNEANKNSNVSTYSQLVLEISKKAPSKCFAENYLNEAKRLLEKVLG